MSKSSLNTITPAPEVAIAAERQCRAVYNIAPVGVRTLSRLRQHNKYAAPSPYWLGGYSYRPKR